MNNKKIVIPGWNMGDNSFGVTKQYLDFISNFGIPEIIHPLKGVVEDADLLILPGGKDILTTRYGEAPGVFTGNPDVMLEYFDLVMLPQYIDKNIPIFGICRGMQSLAVHFGCKLFQHINGHLSYTETPKTHKVYSEELWRDRYKGSRGFKKGEGFMVNSYHHQSVKTYTEDIVPLLRSSDGTLEAFKHRHLNVAGVQYHPERMNDMTFSGKIIREFLELDEEEVEENIQLVEEN